MIAGPNVTGWTMRRAVAYTTAALAAATEIDVDRSEEDRKFLADERAKLEPFAPALRDAEAALKSFDLGAGVQNQSRVTLGDDVLDRGVQAANARTKVELRAQSGLGADHVFGSNVASLTRAPLRTEPSLVLKAVARLDDLPQFNGRDTIKKDLSARAEKLESLLVERDRGMLDRARLASQLVKLVADASEALAKTKAALDGRFPRQRDYVGGFFLDVSTRRTASEEEPTTSPLPTTLE